MPLKAEGIAILVILVVVCIILFLLGIYCHFCAEVDSGGHLYSSDENMTRVMYIGKTKNGGPPGPKKGNKCKCGNRFKGSCKKYEGEDFVDDGQDGRVPDWSDHGGDKGLDPDWGNKPDPLRSALGGTGNSGGGNSGDNSWGGGNSATGESSGMMMRDD